MLRHIQMLTLNDKSSRKEKLSLGNRSAGPSFKSGGEKNLLLRHVQMLTLNDE